MKTFVCTCGTSIITKRSINIDRFKQKSLTDWDEFKNDIDAIYWRVMESLEKISLPRDLNDTSAEIKSLIKMGLQPDDGIILITTDTIDGKLCAEIIRDFLSDRKILPSNQVEIKPIIGLQASDGYKFEKEGLKKSSFVLCQF